MPGLTRNLLTKEMCGLSRQYKIEVLVGVGIKIKVTVQ